MSPGRSGIILGPIVKLFRFNPKIYMVRPSQLDAVVLKDLPTAMQVGSQTCIQQFEEQGYVLELEYSTPRLQRKVQGCAFVLLSPDGLSCAKVIASRHGEKVILACSVISVSPDGNRLITSNQPQKFDLPKNRTVKRLIGGKPSELVQLHHHELVHWRRKHQVGVLNSGNIGQDTLSSEQEFVDFLDRRGTLIPLTEEDLQVAIGMRSG